MTRMIERFAAPFLRIPHVLNRVPVLLVLVPPLALAGCNTVQDPMLASPAPAPAPTASGEVASDYALASLSAFGPRVKSVYQSATKDGLEQRMALADRTLQAGENSLTIEVGKVGQRHFQAAPSRADIASEMRAALPGVGMTLSAEARTNTYGAYGYATGRTAQGAACIYAWQVARDLDPLRTGGPGSSGYAAQIRLRYCEPAGGSSDLPGLMAALKLKPVNRDTLAVLKASTRSGLAAMPMAYAAPSEPAASYAPTTRSRPQASVADTVSATAVAMPTTSTTVTSSTASATSAAVTVPIPN